MKIVLVLALFLAFALTVRIDDLVINDLSLNNGFSDIMINFNEQVVFDEEKLDKMNWEQKGKFNF